MGIGQQTDENRLRLLLISGHVLFRASLAHFLASEPGLEVVSECSTFPGALEALNGSSIDILLLDFDLGSECGNEFISAAREAGYQGRFTIVANAIGARTSAIALKLGASGIFLKSEGPERLLYAIRLMAHGEVWVDPKVIQILADQLVYRQPQFRDPALTAGLDDRERNVLLGILGGLTNKKMGENMGLSESSVKNVVQTLFAKAGVKKRSQLVRVVLEGSLIAARDQIRRP
jgi:two-component system nitrate/nitrite response regulator NarL